MEKTSGSVDDWLAANDEDGTLRTVDRIITAALSGEERALWRGVLWGGTEQEIIGYAAMTQPRSRGRTVEWFLIGLARQKDHTSLYVNAVEDGAYLGRQYADRLGRVKAGAASLSFRRLADIDLEVLAEMCEHAARIHAG